MANPDPIQLQIKDRLVNNIRPNVLGLFDIFTEQQAGKTVVVVNLAGGMNTPYYIRSFGRSEKGCFLRVGSCAQPMNEQLIEDVFSRRQKVSLSTTLSPNQRLTFEQLKIYYQEHGLALNDKFADTLDMRLASGEYNYLAYLLADQNGASVRFAKYRGKDKNVLAENEEYGYRCLITSTHRLLDRLVAENKTYAKITHPFRVEKSMVDKSALREAVINAIVHNDYSLTEPVVEMYDDRITVSSGGGLVPGLSREDFFAGRSLPRNRELMRVFRDVELVERLGSGMRRMLGAYDRSIFDFTPSFIVVTFWFEKDGEEMTVKSRVQSRVQSGVQSGVKSTDKILQLMESNPTITAQELSDALGYVVSGIEKNIKKLKESGAIRRIGSDKDGRWEVVNFTPAEEKNTDESAVKMTEKVVENAVESRVESRVQVTVESRVQILQLMESNPTITARKIADTLGVVLSGVEKHIKILRESGVIRHVGPNRGGRWEVLKK